MTASDDGVWLYGIASDSVDDARLADRRGPAWSANRGIGGPGGGGGDGDPERVRGRVAAAQPRGRELADEFASAVAAPDTEHQGVTLEMTGPWPPHPFAGIDQANP